MINILTSNVISVMPISSIFHKTTNKHIHARAFMYICMYAYVCLCACVACVCVCACVRANICFDN